eukprot:748112-Hanusia_phi.AAC.4
MGGVHGHAQEEGGCRQGCEILFLVGAANADRLGWQAFGNVIENTKPSYTVQAGTWGPPKETAKDAAADIFSSGGGKVMGGPIESDAEQVELEA